MHKNISKPINQIIRWPPLQEATWDDINGQKTETKNKNHVLAYCLTKEDLFAVFLPADFQNYSKLLYYEHCYVLRVG